MRIWFCFGFFSAGSNIAAHKERHPICIVYIHHAVTSHSWLQPLIRWCCPLFVYTAQAAIWGLMNESKWRHGNKISNAQSNPTLSNSPVYRISNGFCANLCYGYYQQDLCQLAGAVQIIWEEHWQELTAPCTFKVCCWDIYFKHSSPLPGLFLLISQVLFYCIHGIVSWGSEEGWIVPFLR